MSLSHTDDSVAAVVRRLGAANRLVVVTHARPDGDALGSAKALSLSARLAGRQAVVVVPDGLPERYAFMFPGEHVGSATDFAAHADLADTIVVVDTSSPKQLEGVADAISARREKLVVIDHHATAGNIGSVQWIDASASAAGVMVAELLDMLLWPTDNQVLDALAIAVLSDTGWLRFSNTDPRTLRHVERWLEQGLRLEDVYQALYQNDRPERLKLMARMLESLELFADGRLAIMSIVQRDFAQTGARPDETENGVNEALRIASVEIAILLVEQNGQIRASLRSRKVVDVAQLAQQFGGGGHARAAGVRFDQPLDVAKAKLVAATLACLE